MAWILPPERRSEMYVSEESRPAFDALDMSRLRSLSTVRLPSVLSSHWNSSSLL